MNAALAFYNASRAYKRELTGEALAGLTNEDMEALRAAAERRWKPKAPSAGPKGLHNAQAFYKAVRESFGSLSQPQVDGFGAVLQAVGVAGWPIAWVAYALATPWHETARTMQPIKEYGGPAYFKKMYDPQGARPHVARRLGNTVPGDGVQFAGRGYVQLTGRTNYARAQEALSVPLIGNPDLAMQADIAAKILIWGMEGGKFTGKKLADYLPESGPANKQQFTKARYIINGQDKATQIADLALKFQAALQAGDWR